MPSSTDPDRKRQPASAEGRRPEGRNVEQPAAPAGLPTIEGYQDFTLIGRGGFAIVYSAWQTAFHRRVAVKVLRQSGTSRLSRVFERERVALGSLSSHPNIVTVYDAGLTPDGCPFLVMEYVPGGSLADLMAHGPLRWQEAVAIGIKLCGALETAHRAGVLHRDIKPENVVLSGFGQPQLADFGIVRMLNSSQTRSLEVNLSVPYAPPELLDGAEPSVRSDVYSLACTIHAAMLGRPTFLSEDESENALVALVVRIHTQPPADLRPGGVPDEVCRLLERAMAKQPAGRHSSALELGNDLQAAEAAAGVPVTPLPVAELSDDADRPQPAREVAPGHAPGRRSTRRMPAILPMSTPRRLGTARLVRIGLGVAVLVIALLGLTRLTSAPDDEGGGPTTSSSPTTTAAPGQQPTTTATSPPVALPAHTRPIPAGAYFLDGVTPVVAFRLDDGWRRPRADRADLVELVRTDASDASLVSIFAPRRVIDPNRSYESLAQARDPTFGGPTPGDLGAWLSTNPSLAVASAGPAQTGSVAGHNLELSVKEPNAVCTPARVPCVPLFQFERTVFVLLEGSRNRFSIFPSGEFSVVVSVEAPPDRFDALIAHTDRLLSTLDIRPR